MVNMHSYFVSLFLFFSLFTYTLQADVTMSSNSTEKTKDLILKAELIGDYPLYPGQRATLSYSIYYKGDIELTKEELPLLEAIGFQKIGEIDLKETTEGDYNVQILSQQVKAIQEGAYSFSSSILEGLSNNVTIKAEIPSYKIEVKPFPEKGKPPSFNGALGQWLIEVQNPSTSKIEIGDSIQLKVTFTGSGERDTVSLPNLNCQPGFSGFFQVSKNIREENQKGISKSYLIELWPLSESIKQIPSIFFSSFNTKDQTYFTVHSEPIPLSVFPNKKEQEKDLSPIDEANKINWNKEGMSVLEPTFKNYPFQNNENLKNAYETYLKAENAKNLTEKKEYFNEALSLYHKNENEKMSYKDKAKLFFNIANIYSYLGEYPWAIFYYERAFSLTPRNSEIKDNLTFANKKIGVTSLDHQIISQEEFAHYLLLLLITAVILSLLSIYFHKLRWVSAVFVLLGVSLLFVAIYKQYFTPLYAVQVNSSILYQDADQEKTTPFIILMGSKVKVMEVQDQGRWIKILTPEGHVGFVLDSTIRFI